LQEFTGKINIEKKDFLTSSEVIVEPSNYTLPEKPIDLLMCSDSC
jgi:hypothetical protein